MSALLDVQGVGSGYSDVPVLSDVSLTVAADEIVSVVGASADRAYDATAAAALPASRPSTVAVSRPFPDK